MSIITIKKFRTWQYWLPILSVYSAEIRSLPVKHAYARIKIQPIPIVRVYSLQLKINKLFLMPKKSGISIIPLQNSKRKLIMFQAIDPKTLVLLKSYSSYLLIALLGYVARFKIFLRLRGLGYKVYSNTEGTTITFKLGFSHLILYRLKFDITCQVHGLKDRMFSIAGSNWLMLSTTASGIQKLKKIDVYRGKGIFRKFYTYKVRLGRKKKK